MRAKEDQLFAVCDYGKNHYKYLDHIRAIAALLVLFGHALHNFSRGVFREDMGNWIQTDNLFYSFLAEGHAGVSLFLVLSGFLFTTLTYGKNVSYWGFIHNRLLRIYPLYVLMVICGAYTFSSTLTFENILGSLFLMQGTSAAHNGGMFTMILWTISTEFIFYLIFPFAISFVERYGWKIIICWLVVFAICRELSVAMGASPRDMPYFTILGRMDQFLLGMLAAIYVYNNPMHYRYWRKFMFFTICAIISSLIFFNHQGGWQVVSWWKTHWLTFEGSLFAVFILCYSSYERELKGIYAKTATYIGTISYSIYLLHFPVYDFYVKKIYFYAVSDHLNNAMLNSLVAVVIVFLLSSLSYCSIERPFLGLRRPYASERKGKEYDR